MGDLRPKKMNVEIKINEKFKNENEEDREFNSSDNISLSKEYLELFNIFINESLENSDLLALGIVLISYCIGFKDYSQVKEIIDYEKILKILYEKEKEN